jgi:hypothetical protein
MLLLGTSGVDNVHLGELLVEQRAREDATDDRLILIETHDGEHRQTPYGGYDSFATETPKLGHGCG